MYKCIMYFLRCIYWLHHFRSLCELIYSNLHRLQLISFLFPWQILIRSFFHHFLSIGFTFDFTNAVLVSSGIYYIYSIILSVRIWVLLIILCQINALFLLWFKYHKNTHTHTAQNRCRFKWITVGIYSMNCKRNALNWMANYLSLYKLQIAKMPNRIAEKNKHFINYSIPFLLDTPWKVYFERKMKKKKIARKLKKKPLEMKWIETHIRRARRAARKITIWIRCEDKNFPWVKGKSFNVTYIPQAITNWYNLWLW